MFVELVGTATSSRRRSTATITISWTSGNQVISKRRRLASMQPSPPPRNVASRMKLEKYARSRTYAGIQRMRAISRKRTRNDERKSVTVGRDLIADRVLRSFDRLRIALSSVEGRQAQDERSW